jgi:FKBP-type peptidyl-prolyl cis-trans isomerase
MPARIFRLFSVLLALTVSLGATAQPAAPAPAAAGAAAAATFPLETYADLGFVFGDNGKFSRLGWTEAQFEAFVGGLRDSFHGKPHEFGAQARALHEEVAGRLKRLEQEEAQQAKNFFKDPARLAQYMKDACKAFNLELSDSGLAYAVRSQNGSVRPEPGDSVVISCRVRASDGTTDLPQLSVDHQTVKVADLPPGPAEGVQMITVGSTVIMIVPPDLSYGNGPWPAGVDEGTPLFFLITLEKVIPGS